MERLFQLCFEEGRDIGDRALLAAIAGECGMEEPVAKRLAAGEDVEAVEAEIAQGADDGRHRRAVLHFASRLGVPGAQAVDVLMVPSPRRATKAGVEVA